MRFTSVLFASLLFIAQTVHANEAERTLEDLAAKIQETCNLDEGRCKSPYFALATSGSRNLKRHEHYKEFLQVALEGTNIWGDTIYEGDVAGYGPTELHRILEIKSGRATVAYFITYFERAVDFSSEGCEYNEAKERYEGTCAKGKIFERAFVNANLSASIITDGHYGQFEEN